MDIVSSLLLVGAGLAVVLFVFVLIREFVCWYFKINEFLAAFRALANDVAVLKIGIVGTRTEDLLGLDADALRAKGKQVGIKTGGRLTKDILPEVVEAEHKKRAAQEEEATQ